MADSPSEQEQLVENDDAGQEDVPQTKTDTQNAKLTVKASIFGTKEGKVTFAWLLYTFLYWTVAVWTPTLQNMRFSGGEFIIWCIGFVALTSCAYVLYEGKYPSGANSIDQHETGGVGRYTATFLTSSVIVDVIVLLWKSCANDHQIDPTEAIRLSLHCVHIFWASLFFYNKFYRFHYHMATRAFFVEWADITWTVIVSATLNHVARSTNSDLSAVHYVYFSFISVSLCGWMLPMMLLKQWGVSNRIVSVHLLILDFCCDLPVICVVLAEEAYIGNTLLFVDVFWKSFVIVRSISFYIVNEMLYKTSTKQAEMEEEIKFDAGNVVSKNTFRKGSTLAWIIYVGVYWTCTTVGALSADYEIAARYEYYTWVGGMIGVMSVYDTWIAGYHATTQRGRSMVAFACTFICTDWILRSFEILYWDQARWDLVLVMVLHAVAVLWALIFFYGHAFKTGSTGGWFNKALVSLLFEWVDIMLMYGVIYVLHEELGACLSNTICIGYFVIASIKLYFWFFPIMFRSADTEWRLHMHMVVLDTVTDLPLIIILFATEAYTIHWFLFFDVSYKIIMLLKTYAYHLVINLILRRIELDQSHQQQLKEALTEDDGGVEIIQQDGV